MLTMTTNIERLLHQLEERDRRERGMGLPSEKRARMVRPEVGRFLNLLIKIAGARRILEIGTGEGYSTIWLGLAAQVTDGYVITLEVDPQRAEVARQNLAQAGLDDRVTVQVGDARQLLKGLRGPFDFVFIDAEKTEYLAYLERVLPQVRTGGLIVADNVISHAAALRPYVDHVQAHPELESVVVPIGRGEAVSLKVEQRIPEAIRQVLDEVEAFCREHPGMYNVPPDAGHFLHILARALGARRVLEIGTSSGYSALWLAAALRETGGRLITVERDAARVNLARKHFRRAGLAERIELRMGDASRVLRKVRGPFDLVFFDASKHDQLDHLQMIFDQIPPGGVIVSDNALTHPEELAAYHSFVRTHPQLESLMVPIGNGFEVSWVKLGIGE
jgi:predicted O-methyltransferase YrrM